MAIGQRGGPAGPARPSGAAPLPRRGHVWLVGAGPGDPGLITVRGMELLASADAVVSDLPGDAPLHAWLRPGAELLCVAHDGDLHTQNEVNAALVERGRAGARVVRLKVGDPYLLGHGGEEAEACAVRGVGVTVVPGVSAALAAPAFAGIPVTHRGLAQDVAIISGHLHPDHPESTVDWAALASPTLTVVIMMGVSHLVAIADALLGAGRAADTPVAVIERATMPTQRVLRTSLESLGTDAVETGVSAPAVVVVGDVAARIDARGAASPHQAPPARPDRVRPLQSTAPPRMPGLESDGALLDRVALPPPVSGQGPLAGTRVLVPRTRARPGLLARDLRRQGADAVETVVSALAPVRDASGLLDALPGADALVLADAEEVDAVVALLRGAGRDVRALGGLTLVAASESAFAALDALGLVSVRTSAEVRVAHVVVTEIPVTGLRVVVCASAAPPMGVRTVRRITLQTDVTAEPDPLVLNDLSQGALDVVTFASSTAAKATAEIYGALPDDLLVAAMGRHTVHACEQAGIRVDVVAEEPGIGGLVAAVCRLVASR